MYGFCSCVYYELVKVVNKASGIEDLFRAKRGLYSGLRVVSYGFWAYLSRASKFSYLLSSVTQGSLAQPDSLSGKTWGRGKGRERVW